MAKGKAVIGREVEKLQMEKALEIGRNLLIEGPVGVGKTFLVQEILRNLDRDFERIDGDMRYSEQKLTGWFDPPMVLKKGYTKDTFIEGPLVSAMKNGKVLFINELNRMPEAVQNVLLPAMDERRIVLPKIGEVAAKPGFLVVATQNPREFTATHALSEALLDRFEMICLPYQSKDHEIDIVRQDAGLSNGKLKPDLLDRVVELVRATREHEAIKRGASVRAAIAVCKLLAGGMDLESACLMAIPSRIEMVSSDQDPREVILHLLQRGGSRSAEKKK